MQLHKLNKTVLSIRNNPVQFLNGLTANTIDQSQNVFLNIHGRIIATFDQIQVNEDDIWIVVESSFTETLLKHIDRYVKLSKVQITNLNKNVYFDISEQYDSASDSVFAIPYEQGRIVISDDTLEAILPKDEFTSFRLNHKIPIQGIDFTDEFVLNVSTDNFVSFTKGCFLGQEPVSKVHNRSRPTWQLVVKYEDECSEEIKNKMTSKFLDANENRMMGFVFVNTEKN